MRDACAVARLGGATVVAADGRGIGELRLELAEPLLMNGEVPPGVLEAAAREIQVMMCPPLRTAVSRLCVRARLTLAITS